ncbi:MAG TPA: hypothetical protein PLW86_18090, partial [Rhodocyclaceae bacterium]|nr:hypothetical protein [Rhodocyclaceae bacterium]
SADLAQITQHQILPASKRFENRQVEHASGSVTEQTRRKIEQPFIDQGSAQQRPADGRTCFDVKLVDSALRQFCHKCPQIDPPAFPRQTDHFGTPLRERVDLPLPSRRSR